MLSQFARCLTIPAGTGISNDEFRAARERLEREDLTVLASYRFEGDRFCQAQRFMAFSVALGDRFIPRVLGSTARLILTPRRSFQRHVASLTAW